MRTARQMRARAERAGTRLAEERRPAPAVGPVAVPGHLQGTANEADWLRYRDRPADFISECCRVYDATQTAWLKFRLWPSQQEVLAALVSPDPADRQLIILKARQLGQTWLCIAWLLHIVIFRPNATVLLFSRRDNEAIEVLARLTGMHRRLPEWLQSPGKRRGNAHEWYLANGSRAMAFPTGTGDSYTATAVLYDEFDLVDNQAGQLGSVKPTVDAGGKLSC